MYATISLIADFLTNVIKLIDAIDYKHYKPAWV